MEKNSSRARPAAAKTTAAAETVEEYLAAVPEPARSTLNKVRAAIRSVVPAETTEVISYRIPAFKYKGMLMWYAAFSDHCSLFPTASVINSSKKISRTSACRKAPSTSPWTSLCPPPC